MDQFAQFWKQFIPIVVTEFGIAIDVKGAFIKHSSPIVIAELEIVTLTKLLQYARQWLLIVVTVGGITIDVNAKQFWKHRSLNIVNVVATFNIVTDAKL